MKTKKLFTPEMFKKAERWVILLIALTVAVTLVVTFLASRKSLLEHLGSLPVTAIIWLAVATAVESALRFWRYHVAGQALRLNVSWQRMAYYYTVGYALIPTPGKVGTAIRIWLLKKYHNLPYQRTAPLLVMDLVSDSIAMCSLAAFALAIIDDPRLAALGVLLVAGLVGGITATLIAPKLLRRVVKILYAVSGRTKPRLFARILLLVHTTQHVLGWRVILVTSLLSALGWALVGIAVGHLVTQLGYPLTASAGTLAITLSTMGGFLTMMPAGVGGAEVTMVGLFKLFSVPLAESVLATAIIRLIVLWATVAAGLALLPIAVRNVPKSSAED